MECLKPRVKQLSATRVAASSGTKRIRGSVGQAIRARILKRDGYVCVLCLAQGIVSPATAVDHIVPLCNGGAESDHNRQSLCTACHDLKTAEEQAIRG